MLPILFSVGSVTVYTLGFLLGIGFLLSSFLAWRRLTELGLKEEKVIDLILTSGLFGLFFSRLFFVLRKLEFFGFAPLRWFLLRHYPGLSFWGMLLGLVLTILWFAKKEKWNFWQVSDELSLSVFPFLILSQLGTFFDGTSPGVPTSLPWGIYFPGSLLRRQPVSLFMAGFLFLIWIFLLRIERQWRGWNWYKSKANGFITLVFLVLLFLANFLLAFWQSSPLYFYWLEVGLSITGIFTFLVLFYYRSGRGFASNEEKKV